MIKRYIDLRLLTLRASWREQSDKTGARREIPRVSPCRVQSTGISEHRRNAPVSRVGLLPAVVNAL